MVTFRREDRQRVARGEITVTFRLWKSAHVRAGKAYATGIGTILIEDVRVVPAALVTEEDVAPTGCADIRAVLELAGEHTGTRIGPETLLHRVQFRYLGDVPPDSARSAAAVDAASIGERLARMDRLSQRGPWTLAVLRVIEAGPRVPAWVLASELGWETQEFKAHVRRLKSLGLTISHEVGYELSEAGRRYVASPADAAAVNQRATGGGVRRSARTRGRSR